MGRQQRKSNCWGLSTEEIPLLGAVNTGNPISGIVVWPGCFLLIPHPLLIYTPNWQPCVATNGDEAFYDLEVAAVRNVFYYSTPLY